MKQSEWKCPACKKGDPTNDPVTPAEMRKFMQHVTEKVDKIEELKNTVANLENSVSFMSAKYEEVVSELKTYKTKMEEMEKRVQKLESEKEENEKVIGDLSSRMREAEQYARKCNIEIVGVPEIKNENLNKVMENIAAALDVDFRAEDIDVVHRVPSRGNAPPKIIAQFLSRRKREEWMMKKRQVPPILAKDVCNTNSTQKVFLNTHLCQEWKDLLWKAKLYGRPKGYSFFKYNNGKIWAKKSKEDNNAIAILSESDFSKLV